MVLVTILIFHKKFKVSANNNSRLHRIIKQVKQLLNFNNILSQTTKMAVLLRLKLHVSFSSS